MTGRIPFRVGPMLATLVAAPFDRSGWAYEEKYDGDRILAYKEGDRVRLLSRNGKDRTERFPEIAAAIRALSGDTLLLDGEVVIFDKKGVSRFQLLQKGQGKPVPEDLYRVFSEGKDKPLFGEKSPFYCAHLQRLVRRYPGCRFILLWRDPVEIYRSVLRAGQKERFFRRRRHSAGLFFIGNK